MCNIDTDLLLVLNSSINDVVTGNDNKFYELSS